MEKQKEEHEIYKYILLLLNTTKKHRFNTADKVTHVAGRLLLLFGTTAPLLA